MPKPAVTLYGITICGMHHYGRSKYDIGDSFTLIRERNNRKDKNAITVKDGTRTVAHVTRRDSAKLSPILDGGFACNDVVYYKVKHEAEVKFRAIGPQHSGTVGFYYDVSRKAELKELLDKHNLQHAWLNST